MELLFLFLAIAVLWLLLLASRIAGTLQRHRAGLAGILAVVAVGGFLLLLLNHQPEVTTDYAQGDAELRAMLE